MTDRAPSNLRDELLPLVVRYCEGELDAAEFERLEDILASDAEARRIYIDQLELHARLAWDCAQREVEVNTVAGETEVRRPWWQRAARRGAGFFTRPTPFSMTVAALVMLVFITAMAFVAAPVFRGFGPGGGNAEVQVIADLAGTHQVKWSDGQTKHVQGDKLVAGQRLELANGLAEIRFRSGARATVEGPAKLKLLSRTVLQLHEGRVSVRVPPSAIGFEVVAPDASIVDLGTRFGVRHSKGTTQVHVFEGKVEAEFFSASGASGQKLLLAQGESAAWTAATRALVQDQADPAQFTQDMPRPQRLFYIATGRNADVGQPDPDWKIVAAEGDEKFKPGQAAVVAMLPDALANSDRSRWISNEYPLEAAGNGATYTYETTFSLQDVDVRSVRLEGRFAVDNVVRAIRLNEVEVEVPDHVFGAATFQQFMHIAMEDGFESGPNTLQIDVYNGEDESYMGLRVELVATGVPLKEQPKAEVTSP